MNNTICTIISNKDHGHIINRRLRSIIEQSVPFDEILFIDDGSTDNSKEILQQFKINNPNLNIKLFLYEDNQGCNIRINSLLDKIKSKYVFLGASDDYFLPNFVAETKLAIKHFPFVKIITSLPSTEVNKQITYSKIPINRCYICGLDIIHYIVLVGFWIPGHCSVLSIDAIKEFGGLHEEFKWHSDMFLNYSIAMRYGIVYLPLPLAIKVNLPEDKVSYSSSGYDSSEQPVIKKAMLEELKKPEYKDFAQCLIYFISGLKG